MPRYTFQERADKKIDILENGKNIAPGGSGYSVDYAKTLGYKPPVVNSTVATPIETPTPVPTAQTTPTLPEPTTPTAQQAYQTGVASRFDATKAAYEAQLTARKSETDTQLTELKKQEQEYLTKIDPTTRPTYDQELRVIQNQLNASEAASRTLQTNFEANQRSIAELESLLNEGNALIKQQTEFGGVSFIRDARINETIRDVQARAGVVEAVISARNGQISKAHEIINQSRAAIEANWDDDIAYYGALLELNQNGQLTLDKESKSLANEKLSLAKASKDDAEATYNLIRDAMTDPDTAQLYEDAGVKLTDTPEQIGRKLSTVSYQREVMQLSNEMAGSGYTYLAPGQIVPADAQIVTVTDSRGKQKQYYKRTKTTSSDSDSTFTTTQVNKGAANAGLSVQEFNSLPTDVRNIFINNSDIGELLVSDVADYRDGLLDYQEAVDDINAQNVPQAAKDYFLGLLGSAPAQQEKGGFFDWLGSFFK